MTNHVYIFIPTRQEDCAKQKALLIAIKDIGGQLNRPESFFSSLKPTLVLIGSASEGTQLCKANELDFSIIFTKMQDTPLHLGAGNDATNLTLDSLCEGDSCLRQFLKPDGKSFDYPKFMKCLLEEVSSIVKRMSLPQGLSVDLEWRPCKGCDELSLKKSSAKFKPMHHCDSCFPAITHTKAGICLILKWKDTEILAVDLIPLFHIKSHGGLMYLFDSVISTLWQKMPENWLRYLRKLMDKDRVLPEAFSKIQLEVSSTKEDIMLVSLKLLNYGDDNNYIIRPSQDIKTGTSFDKYPHLRETYVHVKALARLLKVEISSYFLKKLVLQDNLRDKLSDANVPLCERLFIISSHPELKKLFKSVVDLKYWRRLVNFNTRGQNTNTMDKDATGVPRFIPVKVEEHYFKPWSVATNSYIT